MRNYLASAATKKGHIVVGLPLDESLEKIQPSAQYPYSNDNNDLHKGGQNYAASFIKEGNCGNWLTKVGQIFDLVDFKLPGLDGGKEVTIRALKSTSSYCRSASETDGGIGKLDKRDCMGCHFNKPRSKIVEIYKEVPDEA